MKKIFLTAGLYEAEINKNKYIKFLDGKVSSNNICAMSEIAICSRTDTLKY